MAPVGDISVTEILRPRCLPLVGVNFGDGRGTNDALVTPHSSDFLLLGENCTCTVSAWHGAGAGMAMRVSPEDSTSDAGGGAVGGGGSFLGGGSGGGTRNDKSSLLALADTGFVSALFCSGNNADVSKVIEFLMMLG